MALLIDPRMLVLRQILSASDANLAVAEFQAVVSNDNVYVFGACEIFGGNNCNKAVPPKRGP